MASKGLDTGTSPDSENAVKRRTRLLFFGINDYEHEAWPKLHNPVSDCEALWQVLKNDYGFRDEDFISKPFYNQEATTDIIIDEISYLQREDDYGHPNMGPQENLIIVFSGHGHFANNEGYWVPYDAPPINAKTARASELRKLISVSEIIKIISNIRAHHILLIIDSCFSEAFAKMEIDLENTIDSNNPEEIPSRWVLTAGRMQKVPDKSEFSRNLVRHLRENADSSISVALLGQHIVKSVRDSIGISPRCESLVDQKKRGGEFFFHRLSPAPAAVAPPLPVEGQNLVQKLREGSLQQHERLINGRYKHLTIENILLPPCKIAGSAPDTLPSDEQTLRLVDAANILWGSSNPHAVLFGEGGMGKTVSLLRLWDESLQSSEAGPIPLFIPLHEFNTASETEKDDFILKYMARHYLQIWELTADVKNDLWQLCTTQSPAYPKVVLLLDGFNEITTRKDQLLIDLDLLSTQARGVQMVIASRFTDIQNFPWARLTRTIELLPLAPQVVATYLSQVNLDMPADPTLRKLFANPMMLTLYSGANNIAAKYVGNPRYEFKSVASYGELLWNYNEAQLALMNESSMYDPDEVMYQTFLFRVLVPYLAYQMETAGRYSITSRVSNDPKFNFKSILGVAFEELNSQELVELFPEFEGKRKSLGLGKLTDLDDREKRAVKVKQYLVDKTRLLVMEGDELRFQHQNFRDFYAVCHLRSIVQTALLRQEMPGALSTRHLPVYLRRLLGEIEREHQVRPTWKQDTGKLRLPERVNLLSRLLDRCRINPYTTSSGPEAHSLIVWNILSIWLEVRKTLAGADLSNLDLRKINFNNKYLTAHHGAHYLAARFDNSLMDGTTFIFNGHYGQVNTACYNSDGTRIVSASDDKKVIEWDAYTCDLRQTYLQHTNKVSCAQYSPDFTKILSASHDLALIEWIVGGEEYEIIDTGHSNRINHAVYSPDGETILTASGDGTLREFSVKTRLCLHTYTGHTKGVLHICFHPQGDRFLSGSADGSVREWSLASKACIRTLNGHIDRVKWVAYSPDGHKALSAADDRTIRLWDLGKEDTLLLFTGHSGAVNSAVFSRDGQKVLSASSDHTVREWSAGSGTLLKIYEGHVDKVNSALYSPDERKIISAADDKSVREWSVETGILLQQFEGQSNWIGRESGSFSPTGNKFLTVNYDKSISEFSTGTGLCLQTLQGHTKWVSGAWYSPDGTCILSTSDDLTLREWSVSEGTCLYLYKGHTTGVKDAVYSADGLKIFSLSYRDEYKEWSTQTGECLLTLADASAELRFIERKKEYRPPKNKNLVVKARRETILVDKTTGGNHLTLENQTGILVQGCDFRRVQPSSVFSEKGLASLRSYGAIFSDDDEARWREATQESYT